MHNIEKEIKRIVLHTNAEAVLMEVNTAVQNSIKEDTNYLNELERIYNIKIFIKGMEQIHTNDFKVSAMGKIDKILKIVEGCGLQTLY